MRQSSPHRSVRRLGTATAVAAFALAGGLAAAGPARAGGLPSPLELHRKIHEDVHDVLRELVRVPEVIHREHLRHLEVFLSGRVWEPAHRHSHVVYRFPVWIDGAVRYETYAYCGDRIYRGPARRPVFWNDWSSARASRWCEHCHARYPLSHACFHARPDVRYRRDFRDDRYRSYDRRVDRRRYDDHRSHDSRSRGRHDDRDRCDRCNHGRGHHDGRHH